MDSEYPKDARWIAEGLSDFELRRQREAARFAARTPKTASKLMAQVLAARGYARKQAIDVLVDAWRAAAGEQFAAQTRPIKLRRGVLEVLVADSMWLQEITFSSDDIRRELDRRLPDAKITSIKFRIGAIG